MSGATTRSAGVAWPADVIHVNEDGWVLVNRGRRNGVVPGLRLLVVGSGIRELRDLYPASPNGASPQEQPVVLRIRRTYEQLEVIYAEDTCAVAIATRTPPQRRPSVYRGPEGELLVWVPLPEGFTFPQPGVASTSVPDADGEDDESGEYTAGMDADAGDSDTNAESASADDESGEPALDTPPENGEQDDERWEEALPLNGVAVGDLVVPAIPVGNAGAVPDTGSAGTAEQPAPGAGDAQPNPFESGRSYDWMHSQD